MDMVVEFNEVQYSLENKPPPSTKILHSQENEMCQGVKVENFYYFLLSGRFA